MVDPVQIAERTDLVRAANIEVGMTLGGIQIQSLADLIKMAELLARGGVAVPPHCRDKPGTVFSLCVQAQEWRVPVMSVINKSYVVSNRGTERIAYESQLIHAVIERNAPLQSRMRYEILGEGDERRCKVWATFKGENKPHEYTSEALGKMRDARGRNDQGVIKGSPLWDTQPEVQLFYSASRQWARLFAPDVILGAYTPEDPQWSDAPPVDVTPKLDALEQKLRDARMKSAGNARGFDAEHVAREASLRSIIEGEANPGDATKGETNERGDEPVTEGRQSDPGGRPDGDRDQGGSEVSGNDDREAGRVAAGEEGADSPGEGGEVSPPGSKEKPKGKR